MVEPVEAQEMRALAVPQEPAELAVSQGPMDQAGGLAAPAAPVRRKLQRGRTPRVQM